MDDLHTWRDLLGRIISNPQERQRLAEATGVTPITLVRWSTQKSTPRLDNLRPLLNGLTHSREKMRALLAVDYPELAQESSKAEEISTEIPSTFYSQILNTSTTSPPILRKVTISTLVLQQILGHLDPRQKGMAAIIMTCVPPSAGKKVHSIRTTYGRGNAPWESYLEQRITFLGAESQAGHAVRAGHPIIVQNRDEKNWFYPTHRVDYEESIITLPLLLGGQTAGCLYIASTEKHYFNQARIELLQAYVDLLIVAFEEDDFYHFEQIELELMPPYEAQQPFLIQFRQQVTQLMLQSAAQEEPLTRQEAELQIWKEIEEKLLYIALNPQEGADKKA
jgi:hypothetical protein